MNKKIKRIVLLVFVSTYLLNHSAYSQAQEWITTTATQSWKVQKHIPVTKSSQTAELTIHTNKPEQTIEGFGTCFNELGWTSLSMLTPQNREQIMKELFAPGIGANFTICRMPVGANDFSRGWYSYDETTGDFAMHNFSIKNDLQTLVPFIRAAQKYNPALKLWASPWSPPTWMKYNKHYAGKSVLGNSNFTSDEYGMDLRGINNGLQPDKEGKEGTNMFIQEDSYFKAYALYFRKFIQAYKQQKIRIGMVMPQNEFNSAQPFPSCTWTAAGLAKFIGYLGPQMQAEGVKVFFGTMERANAKLVDTILINAQSKNYINGVGFQWAGKGAIPAIHQQYPSLTLYQSEQECGNGKNDWKYGVYTWGLLKHYLTHGANAYMYWNTSLKQGGISTWGWKQNSLIVVDTTAHTYKYTYEYYLLKHLSHYVKPGAKRLQTSGPFTDVLAFQNTDRSIVVVVRNDADTAKKLTFNVENKTFSPTLEPDSFSTFYIKS